MRLIRTAVLFALLMAQPAFAAHSVTLTWNASTTPNVTYDVFQIKCTTAQDNKKSVKHNAVCAGVQTKIATGLTVLTYVDNSVQAGFSYEYYVQAVDSTPTSSVPSNTEVATVAPDSATGVTVTSQ